METVQKPWGSYTVIHDLPKAQVKELVVKPGEMNSLQSHDHRDEVWVVVQGTLTVSYGEEEKDYGFGEVVQVPRGQKHRMINNGDEDMVLVEVWLGDELSEEDIHRYSDKYGRVK